MLFRCQSGVLDTPDAHVGIRSRNKKEISVLLVAAGEDLLMRHFTLDRIVAPYVAAIGGDVGLYVRHLGTGEEVSHQGDTSFLTASIFKLPILLEIFRRADARELDLGEEIAVPPSVHQPGSGVLCCFRDEVTLTMQDLAMLMIIVSDNTATHVLLNRLGTETVNRTLRILGFPHTSVALPWRDSVSTPRELGALLCAINDGRVAEPQACQMIMTILKLQQVRDRIPLLLPDSVAVAHKTGDLIGIRNDAGIVFAPSGAFVLVCLTRGLMNAAQGCLQIGRLSRAVFDYFGLRGTEPQMPRSATSRLSQALVLLRAKDWEAAGERFSWALMGPTSAPDRALAILGLAASLVHVDVESGRTARIIGLLRRFWTRR